MPDANEIGRALEDLLGLELNGCACGRGHHVPTREVLLQPGALQRLPQIAARRLPAGSILLIADADTWGAAGKRAAELLQGSGRRVTLYRADGHPGGLHADDRAVQALAAAFRDSGCTGLLAVGSGTINDIAKSAATAVGCPQITVATAASMNGYPSAISALTVQGVKTTQACHPPAAIIADPQVLATAPAAMSGAGFGDLLSKNASTADWLLGRHLFGEYYCDFAAKVAEEAVRRCIAQAAAIRQNTPQGLAVLAEGLMRSGISMVLAGSSSPASGGEHLISHLWDMSAHWSGRRTALHGQQTGVATLMSLALYQKLLALDDAALGRICAAAPPSEPLSLFEARISSAFGDLAAAVLPFARRKHLDAAGLDGRRRLIRERFPQIRAALAQVVISPALSRSHLLAAGAPVRAADLGISAAEAAFAYRHARWIRNRYTVLDLAAELGQLEAWEAEVLREVQ